MLTRTAQFVTLSVTMLATVAQAKGPAGAPAHPGKPYAPRAAPMVEVPAGEFLMGSSKDDHRALARERPQRRIYLSTFWVDVFEVTNARYEKCVAAGVCKPARQKGVARKGYYADTDAPLQPVVGVTLEDAATYCEWVGRRLPTEAEWEKAARGTDGRTYPWGNQPPTCELANFRGCGMVARTPGSYPEGVSPYGAHDMAGNVIEWTSTPYTSDYLRKIPDKDPPDPKRHGWRVIRGGSWGSYGVQLRAAMRRAWKPDFAGHTIGFRCVSSTKPEATTR